MAFRVCEPVMDKGTAFYPLIDFAPILRSAGCATRSIDAEIGDITRHHAIKGFWAGIKFLPINACWRSNYPYIADGAAHENGGQRLQRLSR